jgi:tungstate transport system ATP-binding protein
MERIFKIRDLYKKYNEKQVLNDINININLGEIYCILGPSGAGKTTLLRILNSIEKPDSGRVFFKKTNLLTSSGKEFLNSRRKMAMVFQDGAVFNSSVYDNVSYGLKIRGINKDEIRKRVNESLKIVGLEGYSERRAYTLSGGEKQRMTFAMTVVLKPDVLLFDEPTASLDPINEKIIEGIIRRINDLGITIIFTTHKQEEALSLATRIAVINKGVFEQIGPPEDIFYRPNSSFIARFVGFENIFKGIIRWNSIDVNGIRLKTPIITKKIGEKVTICIRPEEIFLIRKDITPRKDYPNQFNGRITRMSPQGKALIRLFIKVNKKLIFKADIPRHVVNHMDIEVGKEITASINHASLHVI